MKAREAAELYIGENVEFSDGRLARVSRQDLENKQVRLQFSDGSIGILSWVDFSTIDLIEEG